jgi:cellulose synthase/poly-beta-1,6-N-acetylglucosamine synthase-like glycosyltransferase
MVGWLEVLFVLFVLSQSLYFLVNLLDVLLILPRGVNWVEERSPSRDRQVHVLIPVYEEPRALLKETIERVYESDYPDDRITVHVVYERDDEVTGEFIDEFVRDGIFRGWSVRKVAVDRSVLAGHVTGTNYQWYTDADDVPRTKAAALTYTFLTQSFAPTDVITVLDVDTIVPRDLFARSVAGLETYDVVQAKQTVRNVEDGALPLLESMGITAWADIVFPKLSKGPYQLLGKGYFLEAQTLYDLDSWEIEEVTEDMALGFAAYREGYSLGVVDCYVQDLCPGDFGDWRRQKERWVSGPYRYWLTEGLDRLDYLRLWTYTFGYQLRSVTHIVGVPVGLAVLALSVGGVGVPFSLPLAVVTFANLVYWLAYAVLTYRATEAAIPFRSRTQKVVYYVLSNPVTQVAYNALWTLPIVTTAVQAFRGEMPTFTVTPKRSPTDADGPVD